jgi:hypothetical protein
MVCQEPLSILSKHMEMFNSPLNVAFADAFTVMLSFIMGNAGEMKSAVTVGPFITETLALQMKLFSAFKKLPLIFVPTSMVEEYETLGITLPAFVLHIMSGHATLLLLASLQFEVNCFVCPRVRFAEVGESEQFVAIPSVTVTDTRTSSHPPFVEFIRTYPV